IQLRYIWSDVPDACMPWYYLINYLNRVNADPFDPDFWAFPSETVLYHDVDPQWHWSAAGQLVWDVTFTFVFSPNRDFGTVDPDNLPEPRGWNWKLKFLPRAAKVDYREVRACRFGPPLVVGDKIFDPVDFK